jgi:hypothetical protein
MKTDARRGSGWGYCIINTYHLEVWRKEKYAAPPKFSAIVDLTVSIMAAILGVLEWIVLDFGSDLIVVIETK